MRHDHPVSYHHALRAGLKVDQKSDSDRGKLVFHVDWFCGLDEECGPIRQKLDVNLIPCR